MNLCVAHPTHLRGQSDVEDNALRLAARSDDLRNVFRKRLGAARRHRYVGAVIGEKAREMLAQAAGAAGDQNVPDQSRTPESPTKGCQEESHASGRSPFALGLVPRR